MLPRSATAARPPRGRVFGGGVRMHQRLTKSSAKPASGPECSVPATGWAGDEMRRRPECAAPFAAMTSPLTEPTSETIAPGFRCGTDLARNRSAGADRHAHDDEIGTGHGGGGAGSTTSSASSRSAMRCRVGSDRDVATIVCTRDSARAARAIEPPIRPTPISARRLNSGAGSFTGFSARSASSLAIQKIFERGRPRDDWPPRCRPKGAVRSAACRRRHSAGSARAR